MSRENVEVIRASIKSIQQGDVETALSYFSEDVLRRVYGDAGAVRRPLQGACRPSRSPAHDVRVLARVPVVAGDVPATVDHAGLRVRGPSPENR